MSGHQLTVAIFFWGSAVVIGLDALKANQWRQRALWALTALFLLAGFLVKPLWTRFPDLSAALVSLVGSPLAWFGLALIAYLAVRSPATTSARREVGEPLASEKRAPLRAVEKDRCAAALLELHDFIGGNLRRFHRDFYQSSEGAEAIERLLSFRGRQAEISREARELSDRNKAYLDLMGLPIENLVAHVMNLANSIRAVEEARDWPWEAQREKVQTALRSSNECMMEGDRIQREIPVKRKEYIDG